MKVKIGKFPPTWHCSIYSKHMNKKYGYVDWPGAEKQTKYDRFIERVEDSVQWFYNIFNSFIFSKMKQTKKIKIDYWDTWGIDSTLSPIILPLLKQLKATNHGFGLVDDEDVPEEIRSDKAPFDEDQCGAWDNFAEQRWNYIMDEMIWAFEQKCRDEWMSDYYGEWVQDPNNPDKIMGGNFTHWDSEGMKAHQARMSNGFRLFGKYYENLWD